MGMKQARRPTAERLVLMLRPIKVPTAQRQNSTMARGGADLSARSYDCGGKAYGGSTTDPAGAMKDPECGTARSRRRLAALRLAKQRLPWLLPRQSLATDPVQQTGQAGVASENVSERHELNPLYHTAFPGLLSLYQLSNGSQDICRSKLEKRSIISALA